MSQKKDGSQKTPAKNPLLTPSAAGGFLALLALVVLAVTRPPDSTDTSPSLPAPTPIAGPTIQLPSWMIGEDARRKAAVPSVVQELPTQPASPGADDPGAWSAPYTAADDTDGEKSRLTEYSSDRDSGDGANSAAEAAAGRSERAPTLAATVPALAAAPSPAAALPPPPAAGGLRAAINRIFSRTRPVAPANRGAGRAFASRGAQGAPPVLPGAQEPSSLPLVSSGDESLGRGANTALPPMVSEQPGQGGVASGGGGGGVSVPGPTKPGETAAADEDSGGGDDGGAGGGGTTAPTAKERRNLRHAGKRAERVTNHLRVNAVIPGLQTLERTALKRQPPLKKAARPLRAVLERFTADEGYFSGTYPDAEIAQNAQQGAQAFGGPNGLVPFAENGAFTLDKAAVCLKKIAGLTAVPEDPSEVLLCYAVFAQGLAMYEGLRQTVNLVDDAVHARETQLIQLLDQRAGDRARSDAQRHKDRQARERLKDSRRIVREKLDSARRELKLAEWSQQDRMNAKALFAASYQEYERVRHAYGYLLRREEKLGGFAAAAQGLAINALKALDGSLRAWQHLGRELKIGGNPDRLTPASLECLKAYWILEGLEKMLGDAGGGAHRMKYDPNNGWVPSDAP